MSLTRVGLTQHPCRLNAARPRKVSTRFRPFWLGEKLRGESASAARPALEVLKAFRKS
jgi:hypothetical protein